MFRCMFECVLCMCVHFATRKRNQLHLRVMQGAGWHMCMWTNRIDWVKNVNQLFLFGHLNFVYIDDTVWITKHAKIIFDTDRWSDALHPVHILGRTQCAYSNKILYVVSWEPEGRYHHRLCTAIAPFWLSTDDVRNGNRLKLPTIRQNIQILNLSYKNSDSFYHFRYLQIVTSFYI